LALRINAGALFSTEIAGEVERIGRAMATLDGAVDGWLNAREPLPEFVAGEAVVEGRAAGRGLDAILDGILAGRRRDIAARNDDRPDLLGLLLQARDDESGRGLDDRELRDEVMTLLLAGFGASALAMAWTLGLLAHHPDIAGRLRGEVEEVLGGRAPSVA